MKFSIYSARFQDVDNVTHLEFELHKKDISDLFRDDCLILPVKDSSGALSQVIALKLKAGG